MQGPKDSLGFPKVREGNGLAGWDSAASGFGILLDSAAFMGAAVLLFTSGGSVLEMGERSPVMSPISIRNGC